jgi:hypothetical protein
VTHVLRGVPLVVDLAAEGDIGVGFRSQLPRLWVRAVSGPRYSRVHARSGVGRGGHWRMALSRVLQ